MYLISLIYYHRKAILMKKKWIKIIILLQVLFLSSCKENLTTDTYSKKFEDKEAKVRFLRKYLKLKTDVEDLEYHIRYYDNSGVMPGPSDWNIRAVFRLHQDSLMKWNLNCNEAIQIDVLKDLANVFSEKELWDLKGRKFACENGYICIPTSNILLFFDSTFPIIE